MSNAAQGLRLLSTTLLVAGLAFSAGCNSKPAAPPSESSQPAQSAAQPQPPREPASPAVATQRNEAAQRALATVDQQAVSAIADTRKAVDAIADKQHDKAMADLESATGKINILLATNAAAALIPVEVQVEVIDTAPQDDKTIQKLVDGAGAAITLRDLPTARLLLHGLMSEIRVRTFSLPLATYPTALKDAARLLTEGKDDQARTLLITALNTLAITDQVTPIPLILAQAAVSAAQDESKTDKATAQTLLNTAEQQLKRCDDLGYAGGNPEYAALNHEIENLQKQLQGSSDTTSLFARLKSDLAGFRNKLSGKKHD